jgi:hypothetical protein
MYECGYNEFIYTTSDDEELKQGYVHFNFNQNRWGNSSEIGSKNRKEKVGKGRKGLKRPKRLKKVEMAEIGRQPC